MASKQEVLELVEGLKLLVIDGKKVMADGKVDLSDVLVIKDLVSQQAALVAAFSGLSNIKMAELGAQEAIEIVTALVSAAREVAAA